MKAGILIITLNLIYTISAAQLTMPANGGSTKAMVGEKIGITEVTVNYGRPALRGREGKIWGQLIPEGFTDDASFGKLHKMPWRAGANENTTVEFSTDVFVEGKPLKAGKYGLHIAYYPSESIVIFSRNTEAWGSFFYDESEDVLRVKVKPRPQDQATERLMYGFDDQTDSSARLSVVWDKLAIGFTVSTELQKLQLASIEREMNSTKTFNPTTYLEAATYYLDNNIMPEKALEYAQSGSSIMPGFYAFNLQRRALNKLNRNKEADSLMNASMDKFSITEINSYGRTLLREKDYQKAFEVYKVNYAKYPKNYVTNVGMMRGYAAMGNNKKAIEFGIKAIALADNPALKGNIENLVNMLKSGKDINS